MITVYSQPECRPCVRVIRKLTEAGILHEVVDLSTNWIARDFVQRAYQAKSTPIVVDDAEGTVIVGYQPDKLAELINKLEGI